MRIYFFQSVLSSLYSEFKGGRKYFYRHFMYRFLKFRPFDNFFDLQHLSKDVIILQVLGNALPTKRLGRTPMNPWNHDPSNHDFKRFYIADFMVLSKFTNFDPNHKNLKKSSIILAERSAKVRSVSGRKIGCLLFSDKISENSRFKDCDKILANFRYFFVF